MNDEQGVNTEALKITEGEYAEGLPWKLIRNYDAKESTLAAGCRHTFLNRDSHVIVPMVIECTNEGGYNCTVLCVQCVLAALGEVRL